MAGQYKYFVAVSALNVRVRGAFAELLKFVEEVATEDKQKPRVLRESDESVGSSGFGFPSED